MLETGNRGSGGPGMATPDAGLDAAPDAGVGRTWPRRARNLGFALMALIVMAAGMIAFLVLVIIPSADAAGGCGGG